MLLGCSQWGHTSCTSTHPLPGLWVLVWLLILASRTLACTLLGTHVTGCHLLPPTPASGAPRAAPTPPRLPNGNQWFTPTEGFEEASGLGHIPHPLILPGFRWVPGSQGRLGGSLLPLPLPTSHWTYNSGTEPDSHCPPNLVWGETSPGKPETPPNPPI